MIHHILCPVVLKSKLHIALRQAIEIAHQLNARITLLNVHPEFMNKDDMEMLRVSATRMMEEFKQTAIDSKKQMKKLIHEMQADDLEIHYLLQEGKPEVEIPKVADELGVDLIVMYTSGRDNIMDYVKGTIAQQVINKAKCPVLVIPGKE